MSDRSRRTSRRLERSLANDSEPPSSSSSSFNSWTVVKLRQELKRLGYPSTGLKAELVSFIWFSLGFSRFTKASLLEVCGASCLELFVILSHFQVARLERAVKERMPEIDARLVILIFVSF